MTSKLLYKPLIHSYERFKYFFQFKWTRVWERFFSLRGPVLTLPQLGRQPELMVCQNESQNVGEILMFLSWKDVDISEANVTLVLLFLRFL